MQRLVMGAKRRPNTALASDSISSSPTFVASHIDMDSFPLPLPFPFGFLFFLFFLFFLDVSFRWSSSRADCSLDLLFWESGNLRFRSVLLSAGHAGE